jgi:hypothetical protein
MLQCKGKCEHQITDRDCKAAGYSTRQHWIHFQFYALYSRSIENLIFMRVCIFLTFTNQLLFLYKEYTVYFIYKIHIKLGMNVVYPNVIILFKRQ